MLVSTVQQSESTICIHLSNDPTDVGNLISGSSAFSKSSLNIWNIMVHVLLKPGLENFENYFVSMWDECNCAVVWTFFALGKLALWEILKEVGIPDHLSWLLKNDAVKLLHQICQQFWKTQQWPQDWKRSVFIRIPKKGNAKECQTTAQLHSSHRLVK